MHEGKFEWMMHCTHFKYMTFDERSLYFIKRPLTPGQCDNDLLATWFPVPLLRLAAFTQQTGTVGQLWSFVTQ